MQGDEEVCWPPRLLGNGRLLFAAPDNIAAEPLQQQQQYQPRQLQQQLTAPTDAVQENTAPAPAPGPAALQTLQQQHEQLQQEHDQLKQQFAVMAAALQNSSTPGPSERELFLQQQHDELAARLTMLMTATRDSGASALVQLQLGSLSMAMHRVELNAEERAKLTISLVS